VAPAIEPRQVLGVVYRALGAQSAIGEATPLSPPSTSAGTSIRKSLVINDFLLWAWVDSNHRPHAYQACALTRLSYRPLDRDG
jgi:hypothetical protein